MLGTSRIEAGRERYTSRRVAHRHDVKLNSHDEHRRNRHHYVARYGPSHCLVPPWAFC